MPWSHSPNRCKSVEFSSLPTLKLRYLNITYSSRAGLNYDPRALSELLMLCPDLCVLIIDEELPVPDGVLQTISRHCTKLQVALLHDAYSFEPNTLRSLQRAVYKENKDLSDFVIVAEENRIKPLKDAAPLFTYWIDEELFGIPCRFSLYHQDMRRFLGLEF